MGQVIWKNEAASELKAGLDYYQQYSPTYAEQLGELVMQRTRLLEHFPKIGRVVKEFGREDIRELVVRDYRVVYIVRDDICYVVALLDTRRELPDWFTAEQLQKRE